jgi:N-acetylglucosamine-6-phosphate deacetylase
MSACFGLKNCRLDPDKEKEELISIEIADGKIAAMKPAESAMDDENIIDAEGRLVIPGLIDVHIQGAGGANVLDGTAEAMETISRTLARLGTTQFLATTIAHPESQNHHLRGIAHQIKGEMPGAKCLGIYIEGPFVNKVKKGGIPERSLLTPTDLALEKLFDLSAGTLRMIVMAPELPGIMPLVKRVCGKNIIATFGHSNATYEETKAGFKAGISHVTHMFNGMRAFHHREPGPISAIMENPDITVEIIGDGHHVHPAAVRMLYESIGKERLIGITDGIPGLGLPDGMYHYYGQAYESRGGRAYYLDGTLIGTSMSLLQIALNLKEMIGCSFQDAIQTVTHNPARLMGIDHITGSIEIGKDADLVILDETMNVWATLIQGQIIYRKNRNAHD